jgi:hypothetical protein
MSYMLMFSDFLHLIEITYNNVLSRLDFLFLYLLIIYVETCRRDHVSSIDT